MDDPEMDWNEYEEYVFKVIEGIQKGGRRLDDLRSGRSNSIVGASGQAHQIDVSFIDNTYSPPTLYLVECKMYGKELNLWIPKVMRATIEDIQAKPDNPRRVLGIIITTKGYQRGAEKYADFYGISLQRIPKVGGFSLAFGGYAMAVVPIITFGHE